MILASSSDFSYKSKLHQQDNLLETIFNRITLPTFVLDQNHTIVFWNHALEQLTSHNKNNMIGTQNQWMAFYASKRPTLADLIIEGGKDDAVSHFYKNKYRKSPLIEDAFEAEDFFPDIGGKGEWLSFTAASIKDENGNVIGAIETLLNISVTKQSQIALKESEERYKQLSITDNLTGLYNKRHFTERLMTELERAHRYDQHFSLCLIDLDNFKQMNDNYGHLFGDQILAEFGCIIKKNLRNSDTAYRYGGEEFVIILPGSLLDGSRVVANRIRVDLVEKIFLCDDDQNPITLTASFGITVSSSEDSKIEELIRRADKALYLAKKTGKNKVESLVTSVLSAGSP
ncbi:sensor domain-containing diguanylate cyclase [Neptunomonas antarctica]|uniref:diguanylate cyclase n=1 Tax=Neptunomonas antarctica TaxID=619304 RepID=A0A1N7NFE9_9GAMM|nr:sensor domain-containing diguanylate cyclase [Neptunomonas antarctica]SIS97040.1 diguanylate cyclase (GGDEF) domain-containing protein [Neptunomonas antarctica]